MRLTLVVGLLLAGAVALIAWRVWGEQAALAALGFGLIATAIQLSAVALMRPARGAQLSRFMARWGAGMGLRLFGVLLLVVAVAADRTHFPPLPVALGFLGVLLPLLVLEVRLLR